MKSNCFQTLFSSYRTISTLGKGGSGIVYKVADDERNLYSLKILDQTKITKEKIKRFKNEIWFCERNNHSNIIIVIDHGFENNGEISIPFYIMPLYDCSLRDVIKIGIQSEKILDYFQKILNGVEAAHLKKIYHRDLKPENILYNEKTDNLVVADFGIAHFSEEDLYTLIETKRDSRLANFQYAAPEQKEKDSIVDHRADIYALGLILNEMFTGKVPNGTKYKTIGSLNQKYAYLDDIIELMIQQDPSSRPSSINEIKKLINIKGQESMIEQKLDKLKNTVIPSTEIDDPIILDPIRLIGFDWEYGKLILKLSQPVNEKWVYCIKTMGGRYKLSGKGPDRFHFLNDLASIAADENDIDKIINYFKGWLIDANNGYKRIITEEKEKKEEAERERIRLEIENQEKRKRILENTKIKGLLD